MEWGASFRESVKQKAIHNIQGPRWKLFVVLLGAGTLGGVIWSFFAVALLGWRWIPWTMFWVYPAADPLAGGMGARQARYLWDWFGLLAIPLALAWGAYYFNRMRGSMEKQIENDRQQETNLQNYMDRIAELLLEKDLRGSQEGSEVRAVAASRTRAALRTLDSERKGLLVQFLYDAGLVFRPGMVHFEQADLSQANLCSTQLKEINLARANLGWANLKCANLIEASLEQADLVGANLQRANLVEANLNGSSLEWSDLLRANLERANLNKASLQGANLAGANLEWANLAGADLQWADLSGANLEWANLAGANLKWANLSGANLKRANLRGANLMGANLEMAYLAEAGLQEAVLTGAILAGASLVGANLVCATLIEADLKAANLQAANLAGAEVRMEALKAARCLEGATLPDGIKV